MDARALGRLIVASLSLDTAENVDTSTSIHSSTPSKPKLVQARGMSLRLPNGIQLVFAVHAKLLVVRLASLLGPKTKPKSLCLLAVVTTFIFGSISVTGVVERRDAAPVFREAQSPRVAIRLFNCCQQQWLPTSCGKVGAT